MLSNTDLIATLTKLDAQYVLASGGPPDELKRICKYGILELCGWTEEAQDFIVNGCVAKLSEQDLIGIVTDRIKRTHGFDPISHFIPLLGLVVGLHSFEAIRYTLSGSSLYFDAAMQSLATLKAPRNAHAHTHFAGGNPVAMNHLNGRSPSVLLVEADKIKKGLSDLEANLLHHGFM